MIPETCSACSNFDREKPDNEWEITTCLELFRFVEADSEPPDDCPIRKREAFKPCLENLMELVLVDESEVYFEEEI